MALTRRLRPWALAGLVTALAGCADVQRPAYFLGDLSDLQRLPEGVVKVDALYRKPGADLAAYDRLMVPPIEIVYDSGSDLARLHPDERELLRGYFRSAIANAFQDRYPLVDAPGPGVLLARIAITDLDLSQSFAEIGEAGQVRSVSSFGAETAVEAEFRDSVTGVRLAAMVDRRGGEASSFGGRIGTLGAARAAFIDWANLFRRRFDEIHGRR